jgi:hypothetical protein
LNPERAYQRHHTSGAIRITPGKTGGRLQKQMSSPEGASYGFRIRDGYLLLYIYSAPLELESVGGFPTSGFTGGYSYTASMRREVPLGQSILKNINNTISPTGHLN